MSKTIFYFSETVVSHPDTCFPAFLVVSEQTVTNSPRTGHMAAVDMTGETGANSVTTDSVSSVGKKRQDL